MTYQVRFGPVEGKFTPETLRWKAPQVIETNAGIALIWEGDTPRRLKSDSIVRENFDLGYHAAKQGWIREGAIVPLTKIKRNRNSEGNSNAKARQRRRVRPAAQR